MEMPGIINITTKVLLILGFGSSKTTVVVPLTGLCGVHGKEGSMLGLEVKIWGFKVEFW